MPPQHACDKGHLSSGRKDLNSDVDFSNKNETATQLGKQVTAHSYFFSIASGAPFLFTRHKMLLTFVHLFMVAYPTYPTFVHLFMVCTPMLPACQPLEAKSRWPWPSARGIADVVDLEEIVSLI